MLIDAQFSAPQVHSGSNVNVTFEWRSKTATTVYLNYNANQFTIAPTSFDLAATPAGTSKTTVQAVTITARGKETRCDVHFTECETDQLDTIEVA